MTNCGEEIAPHERQQAQFRAEVRALLESHAEPKREQSIWALGFHTKPDDAAREFSAARTWQRLLYDHNLAGLTYPSEFGGRGGEPWMESIYREETANYDVPSEFIASMIAMLGPALMRWGTELQKQRLMPRLLSGADTYCQLFSEPGAGSDLAGLATLAATDGDQFVVNGQKVWNSGAQWSSRGMLLVRSNPDLPKHQGITFMLVDMDSPGIDVRPLVQATGAATFNEVFLTDVRVPIDNVLGEINAGWAVARTVLSYESAFIGAGSTGSSFERLAELARVVGRTQDRLIRQDLVAYYIRERVLKMMGERILTAVRRRESPPIDPSILKLYVAESRMKAGNLALTLGGARACIAQEGDEIAQWCQAELLNRFAVSIGGGTNEVQRNNLAERALGLPREPHEDRQIPWTEIRRS